MERLTEYHNGVAVIKDKSRHKEAMERLVAYEETELTPERIREIDKAYTQQAKELGECKAELERLKKDNRWIPVEERLPENKSKALIQCERGYITIVDYDGGFNCWRSHDGRLDNRNEFKDVVAWKPLPERYEPEEQSNDTLPCKVTQEEREKFWEE